MKKADCENPAVKPKGKRGRPKKTQAAGQEAALPFLESILRLPEKVSNMEERLKDVIDSFEEVLRENRQIKEFFKYGKKPEWGKV